MLEMTYVNIIMNEDDCVDNVLLKSSIYFISIILHHVRTNKKSEPQMTI